MMTPALWILVLAVLLFASWLSWRDINRWPEIMDRRKRHAERRALDQCTQCGNPIDHNGTAGWCLACLDASRVKAENVERRERDRRR